jgi:hypothetical protein
MDCNLTETDTLASQLDRSVVTEVSSGIAWHGMAWRQWPGICLYGQRQLNCMLIVLRNYVAITESVDYIMQCPMCEVHAMYKINSKIRYPYSNNKLDNCHFIIYNPFILR